MDAKQRVTIYLDNEGDPHFFAILGEMWDLHVKKGRDYGSDEDPLANLRASEAYGIPAWVGALVRQNDKLIRLKNVAKGVKLANESAEDSLIDNACYAVLALILYREALNPPQLQVDHLYRAHKEVESVVVKDGNNAAQRLAEELAEKDRRDKEQQEANRRALEEGTKDS